MLWKEIVVKTTTELSDFVADGFFAIGCSGVKILDRNDILDVIQNGKYWDYIDEDLLQNADPAVKVSGFVNKDCAEAKRDELLQYLQNTYQLNFYSAEIILNDCDDTEWYDNWKKFYQPIHLGRYVVVPKWLKYEKNAGETIILIDPGMAFGTGEHESTQMCLKLLSTLDVKNKSIIDVGTGSGILGIGAALDGANSVYMCDIDSVSVAAAKQNAELNGVLCKVEIENADLLEKGKKQADIVLANLTADILIRLSKELPRFLKVGGALVCSGIIHKRKQEVLNAFLSLGFYLICAESVGEWDALRLEYHGN